MVVNQLSCKFVVCRLQILCKFWFTHHITKFTLDLAMISSLVLIPRGGHGRSPGDISTCLLSSSASHTHHTCTEHLLCGQHPPASPVMCPCGPGEWWSHVSCLQSEGVLGSLQGSVCRDLYSMVSCPDKAYFAFANLLQTSIVDPTYRSSQ